MHFCIISAIRIVGMISHCRCRLLVTPNCVQCYSRITVTIDKELGARIICRCSVLGQTPSQEYFGIIILIQWRSKSLITLYCGIYTTAVCHLIPNGSCATIRIIIDMMALVADIVRIEFDIVENSLIKIVKSIGIAILCGPADPFHT